MHIENLNNMIIRKQRHFIGTSKNLSIKGILSSIAKSVP